MFVKLLTITVSFQNLHFLYSFFPIFFFYNQRNSRYIQLL